MRPPTWFKGYLATLGGRIRESEITEERAADQLKDQIFTKNKGRFAHDIVREYARRRLKTWLSTHHRVATDSGDDGQTDLFPELPRALEISPGRFAHVSVMTRRDWTAAIKQAETKASNASGHAEAIKRIADKVIPLLTDDELTTAEVWQRGSGQASGGDAR